MRRLLACGALALAASVAPSWTVSGQRADARDVTYTRDVAPILYQNCAYCHRPGEVAPFSLLS